MNINEIDLKHFKKLKCKNVLDLALITPKEYEDNYLSSQLNLNYINVIDAKIEGYSNRGRVLKVNIFAKNLNLQLEALFFNFSKYHLNLFSYNKELFLKGKIEAKPKFQLMQPKVIEKIDSIEVKYRQRDKELASLIKKYVTSENLKSYSFDDDIIKAILTIHNPTREFVKSYKINRGFYGEYLYGLKFIESYNYMLQLKSKKREFLATKPLSNDIKPFISSLPFELTNDQKKAIFEIKQDLASEISAKRVIIGDVGCGKTMVILTSAVIAFPNRAILMAPTTILVNQIYNEAKKFLPKEIKTILVSSNTKNEDLSEYHFIIGTHKLLYQELPKADLIMIDEQHRFGTEQRNLLNKLVASGKKRPHFLQFSATPIPRTKTMMDSNLIDFSLIKELPFKKDITTTVVSKENFKELLEHIQNELNSGNQVAIIYPLVEESENFEYLSIEEAKEFWEKRFDGVFVTHGKDKNKDEVLAKFRDEGKILLATTVVEVGISLPKLSTIVISGADRLGFATLHQLRGRVSRTGLKGYCFLYSKKSSERLKEFIKTKNGFEIAELDLKFRNSGDLLNGTTQSGKNFEWLSLVEDEEIIKRAREKLKISTLK